MGFLNPLKNIIKDEKFSQNFTVKYIKPKPNVMLAVLKYKLFGKITLNETKIRMKWEKKHNHDLVAWSMMNHSDLLRCYDLKI